MDVPIFVGVEDAAVQVARVALVVVAVVGLALEDLRAAALAVGPVTALAGTLEVLVALGVVVVAAVVVVLVVVSESRHGEQGQAQSHDEQQLECG